MSASIDVTAASKMDSIKREIEQLATGQMFELLGWLDELANDAWDKQIEEDSKAGRLDKLVANVDAEIDAGHSAKL